MLLCEQEINAQQQRSLFKVAIRIAAQASICEDKKLATVVDLVKESLKLERDFIERNKRADGEEVSPEVLREFRQKLSLSAFQENSALCWNLR